MAKTQHELALSKIQAIFKQNEASGAPPVIRGAEKVLSAEIKCHPSIAAVILRKLQQRGSIYLYEHRGEYFVAPAGRGDLLKVSLPKAGKAETHVVTVPPRSEVEPHLEGKTDEILELQRQVQQLEAKHTRLERKLRTSENKRRKAEEAATEATTKQQNLERELRELRVRLEQLKKQVERMPELEAELERLRTQPEISPGLAAKIADLTADGRGDDLVG